MHARIEPAAAERFVRLPEILARSGLSRATIYRKIGRGEFPRSFAIGANSAAWYSSDFDRWLQAPMAWTEIEHAA